MSKNISYFNQTGRGGIIILLLMMVLSFGNTGYGYAQTDNVASPLDTIPEDARALFDSLSPKPDTARIKMLEQYRSDKFIKRFSIHTNLVDWATLVPNIGVEFDLNSTPRTNYSVALMGKLNGNSTIGKFVYNVASVRVEGRKYWRTGKYGKAKEYYNDYVALYTDTASIYFNADTLAGHSYYADEMGFQAKDLGIDLPSLRETSEMTDAQKDSLDFAEDSLVVDRKKFRLWLYNNYHKFRRNVTSGRTLDNPRNWRAYYFGVYAGSDAWSICLSGNGMQGYGFGVGVLGGYTLPLFPQKYPGEGSLDLDLGLAIGWKFINNQKYEYDAFTQHYKELTPLRWQMVPYPLIQDIHVSLVWRFRGIKHKVDKSLIDDYDKKISEYKDKMQMAGTKYTNIMSRREEIIELMKMRNAMKQDSSSFWTEFNRRRLEAAMLINPDTVFTGVDLEDYLRIFKGIEPEKQKKYLLEQEQIKRKEAEKAAIEQEKAAIKAHKMEREMRDSMMRVYKDSLRQAKALEKKKAKSDKGKDSNKEKKTKSTPAPKMGEATKND